jgi:hypothetical protein
MKTITAPACLPDEDIDPLAGLFLGKKYYDLLIRDEDITVLKPDGSPLLIFKKGVLPASVCKAAYPALRKVAATEAGNRGMAAGIVQEGEWKLLKRPTIKATPNAKVRMKPIKKDGTLSNTSYAKLSPSGVIGFMDRNSRFPYCRLTAFNMHEPEKFAAAMPFIKAVDDVFKKEMPDRYAAQMDYVKKTSKDFVIHGTAFTTITINLSFRTAAHKDEGDLKEGFGVISVLRAGNYKGCHLIIPKYRVAVDLNTQDVLLYDVHEMHSNSPLRGIAGCFERVSCVFYYREMIQHCGSAKEEQQRAMKRKKGDKLHD